MAHSEPKQATKEPGHGASDSMARAIVRTSDPASPPAAPAQERRTARTSTIRHVGGMGHQSPWIKAQRDHNPAEGARLIRAFMRITDPAVRRMIIYMAETATGDPGALAQTII